MGEWQAVHDFDNKCRFFPVIMQRDEKCAIDSQ